MADTSGKDIKNIWQSQKMEGTTVTLEDIRKHAGKFRRRVRNRNLVEYIASVVVIAGFAFNAWNAQGWMIKAGSVLVVAATVFVMWQLHRRGRADTLPDGATAAGVLAFHRAQLVRQRDAVRTVGGWYIAPFVPGMALTMLGRYFQSHVPGRTLAADHTIIIFISIIMALVALAIWLMNLWGAARLQNRIHELDKLRAE